jgi:hypothetical protein
MLNFTLTISHCIYLTKEQRYDLIKRKEIEVIGVSIPVWFCKGKTSEPAMEIFNKYIITNDPDDSPIESYAKGYKINLPQLPKDFHPIDRPSLENWEKMTAMDRDRWNKENPIPPSADDLMDAEKGGVGALYFKRHSKLKDAGKKISLIHIVEIKSLKILLESLTN